MPLGGSTLAASLERCCVCSYATRRSASTYSAIKRGISRRQPELGSRPPAASRQFYESEQNDSSEYQSRPIRARDTEFFKRRGRLRSLKLHSDRPRYADRDDRVARDKPGFSSRYRNDERDANHRDENLSYQSSRRPEGYDAHSYSQADPQRYLQSIKERAGIRTSDAADEDPAGPRGYVQLKAAERREELTPAERQMKEQRQAKLPLHIEYTTPASEFLYGTSVVKAALNSDRRKLYKLYVGSSDGRTEVARDDAMVKLARLRNVEVTTLTGYKNRLLDMMSKGRPHNGYVLETSPIARPPVECLETVRKPLTDLSLRRTFPFTPARQSAEEAEINGTEYEIVYGQGSKIPRYPFLLMLDGVVDTGNVGGILRSAFFLGVDAVVLSTRMASLTAAALKAAAGAAESMTILSVHNTTKFVRDSQANGWRFFASVAPTFDGIPSSSSVPHYGANNLGAPLMESPCVLMLGAESTGLPDDLVRKADCKISIEGARSGQAGVDSLNVSVAAGILAASFLRAPDVVHRTSHATDIQDGIEDERKDDANGEKLW